MDFVSSLKVEKLLLCYPATASERLRGLRSLILDVANEIEDLQELVETTKWGEPSYVTKHGSTIRMDWKEKTPDKYYLFFTCSTSLVSSFKMMVGDQLQFEGNRAIVLSIKEVVPETPLRKCISLALRYHKLKHLPFLGV